MPRVSPGLRAALAQALAPYDTPALRDRYRRGDIPRADRVQDLDARYRWDLFWRLSPEQRRPVQDAARTDQAIDTALRLTVPPLDPQPPGSRRPAAAAPDLPATGLRG